MPTRRRPPIAGLRRLLLLLLVVGLVVVAVVFAVRRRGEPAAVDSGDSGPRPEGEITLIGEGFEFTQSEEDRPVFRIRGESVRVRRGSVVLLEDVGVTIWDEEGTPYHVEAAEASYDRDTRDATLEGSLRLMGPDGMVLTADGLEVTNRGQRIETAGPAELLYGGLYRLTADSFIARLHLSQYALAGRAQVDRLAGPEPASLRSGSMNYRRDETLMRAETKVRLERGADLLTTDRLNVHLTADERRVVMIHARGAVEGRMRLGERSAATAGDRDAGAAGAAPAADEIDRTPALTRLCGDSLIVHFDDAGDPERAELQSAAGVPAVLISEGAGGVDQTLTAARIETRRLPGGGQELAASGAPALTETRHGAPAGEPPLRTVTTRLLTATLDAEGDAETIVAEGGVDYRAADLTARGERMTYRAADAAVELTGDPVHAVSERGELLAPRVVYEESGLLRAEGGVRATLAAGAAAGLEGSPLGSGEGPVRIESQTAFWRDQPPATLFRGEVRAWRGDSLLLAAELRGDREDGVELLTAGGGVKTVWTGTTGGDKPGEPVEVSAQTMVYRRPAGSERGTVVYSGDVESEQGERTLACAELEIELDDHGRAERMTCTGAVRLEDRATDNVAAGERAVYDLAARAIEITGDPVKLTKGDGGAVEGRRVLYEVDAGRARVLSGGAGQTPPEDAGGGPAPEDAGTEPPPAATPGSGG